MRINDALSKLGQAGQSMTRPVQGGGDGESFGKMLNDALKEVNGAQNDSAKLQGDLMANKPVEVHDLMIAMEKASTSMQLTMAVRNKVLEAYQEISRMQV